MMRGPSIRTLKRSIQELMKTITLDALTADSTPHTEAICQVLEAGGLVCLPCNGRYRIIADFQDVGAVMRLFQSKRRVRKAPALVFISDDSMLPSVIDNLEPQAQVLMDAMWPGPLTLLCSTQRNLPKKIAKQIDGGKGKKVGVRIPETPWVAELVRAFGRPVIVSSANREKKGGDTSPAQIRKNFGREIDLFIDAGDLSSEPSSTVVEIVDGTVQVVRQGAITEQFIRECMA